jgi:predicted Zn-dependent protease
MGSSLLGTLPFSRRNEEEADHYGLILMAIAGYDPQEAVYFWDRMAALSSGGTPQFLSTHPMSRNRARNMQRLVGEARSTAAEFGVFF